MQVTDPESSWWRKRELRGDTGTSIAASALTRLSRYLGMEQSSHLINLPFFFLNLLPFWEHVLLQIFRFVFERCGCRCFCFYLFAFCGVWWSWHSQGRELATSPSSTCRGVRCCCEVHSKSVLRQCYRTAKSAKKKTSDRQMRDSLWNKQTNKQNHCWINYYNTTFSFFVEYWVHTCLFSVSVPIARGWGLAKNKCV